MCRYTSKGARLLQLYTTRRPENTVWDAEHGWRDMRRQGDDQADDSGDD